AVDDMRAGLRDALAHMADAANVAPADVAGERMLGKAERGFTSQPAQNPLGRRAAGGAVGHETDLVSARRLSARGGGHMSRQPANRSAEDVQDIQESGGCFHASGPSFAGAQSSAGPQRIGEGSGASGSHKQT